MVIMKYVFRAVRWIYERPTDLVSRIWASFASSRVLVLKDDEILVIDQTKYCELPGGAVNHGEKFEKATEREVKEETGLNVEIKRCVEEKSMGSFLERIFLAEPNDTGLEASWEGEPRWLRLNDVESHTWRFDRDIEELIEKAQNKGK